MGRASKLLMSSQFSLNLTMRVQRSDKVGPIIPVGPACTPPPMCPLSCLHQLQSFLSLSQSFHFYPYYFLSPQITVLSYLFPPSFTSFPPSSAGSPPFLYPSYVFLLLILYFGPQASVSIKKLELFLFLIFSNLII